MVLGADHLLPSNYISYVTDQMNKDRKIAVCSGQIAGERSVVPRGSGRVVRADFWRKIGFQYPLNYGFETYLLIKAQAMGYKVKVLEELKTRSQRRTRQNYKKESFIGIGKSLKALGYSHMYAAARIGSYKAKRYDVIHIHSLFKIIPELRKKYPDKKLILHYHGSEVRTKVGSLDPLRLEAEDKSDIILVATPDLVNYLTNSNPKYIPNPVDTEHFFKKSNEIVK
jgi:hypothetical protein